MVLAADNHLHVAGADQDDLFIPVDMRQVADLAFVEGGGVHVNFLEIVCRLVEDLPAFSFIRRFHRHFGPIKEEGRCLFGAVGKLSPPGHETEDKIIGRG